MNNKERLESHHRMYSWIKEQAKKNKYLDEDYERDDWEILNDTYPELLTFVENLLSNLESYVKREQELFDVENHILWVDYRDYKFKIWLDAERNPLKGDILLNDEIVVVGLESDSLTHLLTELERQVNNQINYRYQQELAIEIIKLNAEIKRLNGEK